MPSKMATYAASISPELFPRAMGWRPAGRHPACGVQEPPPLHAEPVSERHLQCVWYDERLRPGRLTTQEGERVEVENPGIWNLEAGPDFLGAVLRVGPGHRRVSGDVEIHLRPINWTEHAHARDARYARVCAHITLFPGTVPRDELPPGTLQISLQQALRADATFAFENIDLAAYPAAARSPAPPCRQIISAWTPAARGALLDAAGEERLRRKAIAFNERMVAAGMDQVVYEEFMTALGFKPNKLAFRKLAQAMPLVELRDRAGGRPFDAYALLLGLARLLPAKSSPCWDETTRTYVRRLWNSWWKSADVLQDRLLPEGLWVRTGLRPANQPERRLMAGALLFAAPSPFDTLLRAQVKSPASALRDIRDWLTRLSDEYWSYRYTFNSRPRPRPEILIGTERADAIMMNVVIPWLANRDVRAWLAPAALDAVGSEALNQTMKRVAEWLFGPDHSPALYRSGLRRQGLIQIHHDYCLNDRSRCATCPFPQWLAGFPAANTRVTPP